MFDRERAFLNTNVNDKMLIFNKTLLRPKYTTWLIIDDLSDSLYVLKRIRNV